MNASELQAIKDRLERATPGPWGCREKLSGGGEYGCEIRGNVYQGTSTPVCHLVTGFAGYENDKEFITNSRQDIQTLTVEVDHLTDRLKKARKIIRIIAKMIDDGEFYDDDEGDCMYCGAEASSDGYHHIKSCRAFQLEQAMKEYEVPPTEW